ncbi:MAG: carotenoid oxygenase family protein [Pseudomonadota bacterium]
MVTRRTLLSGAAALAALPSSAFAAPRRLKRGFQNPPRGGYDTPALELVAGRPPADLEGTYYLNGPAFYERGGERYGHWFDGDGMIHAFQFSGGRVSHRGRHVETTKFLAEEKAGRFLYPAFGTAPKSPASVGRPDDVNVANISILPFRDEVLALWEGGSAYALDPETLSTRGPKVYADDLAGAPFSAHPRISADGTVWNFGHDPFSGRLAIYEIGPYGALKRWGMVQGGRGMCHDFIATARHLVFVFPPCTPGRSSAHYLGKFVWRAGEPREIVVVSKETLEIVRRHELPGAFQFHHFNGWEETDGTIRFASCAYPDDSWMREDARAVTRGVPFSSERSARFEAVTLRPDGRASVETDGAKAEFPMFRPESAETRAPSWCSGYAEGGVDALVARDAEGSVIATWAAGPDVILGEHVFAGRRPSRYLIGTQFDAARGRTLLSAFRADAVADGPVAIWTTPKPIPLPLHGRWA